MKTLSSFGIGIAIANALLTLVLFFAGFHSDPAKLGTAAWVGGTLGVLIYVVGLCYGLKTRRAEIPSDKPYAYGQALGNALFLSLVAVVVGVLFQFLYETVINPGFIEVGLQAQRAKMEAKGLSDEQIDKAMGFMKTFSKPIVRAIFSFIALAIFDLIVSLIVAACFTRKNPDEAISL